MERLPLDVSPSRAISERIATQSAPMVFSKENAPGKLGAGFSVYTERSTAPDGETSAEDRRPSALDVAHDLTEFRFVDFAESLGEFQIFDH